MAYNTGTTASAGGGSGITQATPFTFTVPAGIRTDDVMLVVVECFTFTSPAPAIATPASGGGAWTPIPPGLVNSGPSGGLNSYVTAWRRVATASDPGSTFTVSFSGTVGVNQFWWAAVLGSYTGASPVDVSGGTGALGASVTCPALTTGVSGDWAVYLGGAGVSSGGITGPAGAIQRGNVVSGASIGAALSDSNGSVGGPGTSIGGGTFSGAAGSWWGAFTVGLVVSPFTATFISTDGNGVETWSVTSTLNGAAAQPMRILRPVSPAAGHAHSFTYALPVLAGLDSTFGDGLDTLRLLNAHNAYNMTIVEPTFAIDPWYADNPVDPLTQQETFMVTLASWVAMNLATTGAEKHNLIGFSKSGIGGQGLILKHPGVFHRCASWDFPADMSTYNQFGASSAAVYGTDANFQAGYRLTSAFITARAAPFTTANRIWTGGYALYQTDDNDYNALLTSLGVLHTYPTPASIAHRWDSGWVPAAAAFLAEPAASGLLMATFP